MSKRKLFIINGIISIFIGGLIYILFRENSYISSFIDSIFQLEDLRLFFSTISCNFIRYYFADFLWAYSLCCFLYAIYLPEFKKSILYAGVVFVFGVLWELLQKTSIVNGTGDFTDVIMYLMACITVILINLKRGKKNEKN